MLASLHAPTGVYNVGAEPVQRHDLVQGYADAAGVESGAFIGSIGRWLIGPRLEPLSRSLRVCSDHFAAQTGWRAAAAQVRDRLARRGPRGCRGAGPLVTR